MSNKEKLNELVQGIINRVKETGVLPWQKPWKCTGGHILPYNYVSGKTYRGLNLWILSGMPYECNAWLTWKQVEQLGGYVLKGEAKKYCWIAFWKFIKAKNADDSDTDSEASSVGKVQKSIPIVKTYHVYNLEQTSLYEKYLEEQNRVTVEKPEKRIEQADKFINGYLEREDIELKIGGDRACYVPAWDKLYIPKMNDFNKPEQYYACLFHEVGHSTGHESRLKRDGVVNPTFFGSHAYTREELTAEFCSVMLCAESQIENTINNSVAYLKSWVAKLEDEPDILIKASSQAQKAVDFILGTEFNNDSE